MSESVLDVVLDYHPEGAGNPTVIATVYPDEDVDVGHKHFISQKEANANARLIAAAPDLLAACKRMAIWFPGGGGNLSEMTRDILLLHAAIAKAEKV